MGLLSMPIRSKIDQLIWEFANNRNTFSEPTLLVLHPILYSDFVIELVSSTNQFSIREGRLESYKTLRVIRSLDLKTDEIIIK